MLFSISIVQMLLKYFERMHCLEICRQHYTPLRMFFSRKIKKGISQEELWLITAVRSILKNKECISARRENMRIFNIQNNLFSLFTTFSTPLSPVSHKVFQLFEHFVTNILFTPIYNTSKICSERVSEEVFITLFKASHRGVFRTLSNNKHS